MGYHLKFLLNAENGGTSTQSEAFFPFNMPSMKKFVCLSVSLLQRQFAGKFGHNQCPRMQKKSTSG